ncbi:MAG: hypothetical protein ABMA64_15105 [Myxococcota bacterium]
MSDLLARARAAADQASTDGVLLPLQADLHPVAQSGVVFDVRRIKGSVHKPHARDQAADPFAPPYTDSLYVEDWPPDHALLLNKFPVLPDHLLLVTRAWADQEGPVDRADWDALDRALGEIPGLGFYNGGRAAGASQAHRHLQLVGRASLGTLPLEPAIRAARAGEVAGWPIPHRVDRPSFDAYRRALADLGRDPDHPGPHSLLRSDDWMLVVPRVHADVDGIPVNALAYVGLLAVRDEAQLGWVRAHGPWAVLAAAAG